MQVRSGWTFLSNHGHVLVAVAKDACVRVRDLAALVGITERAAAQILADLEAGGYIAKEKIGRRNRYQVNAEAPLRHSVEEHRTVRDLLRLARRA